MGILPNDSCFSVLEARIDSIGIYFYIGPRTRANLNSLPPVVNVLHLRLTMTSSRSKEDTASPANVLVGIFSNLGRSRERFQIGGLL
jgi:hypothetical protein